MRPELLIVVTARGGSKGIPRKNIRPLAGKPLIAWTAETIRAANLGGTLAVLSTEDEEIASVARAAGLEVPFMRPRQHATDESPAEAAVLHALDWASARFGGTPERVMLLQPTSPFRPAQALVQADEMLKRDADVDAVVGVKAMHRSLSRLFYLEPGDMLRALSNEGGTHARRQDVKPIYTPNGAMYVARSAALQAGRSFYLPRSRALVMDAVASIDIDDETDWQMAEALAQATRRP